MGTARTLDLLVTNLVLTALTWAALIGARLLCEGEAAAAAWSLCAVAVGIFGPPFLLHLQLQDKARDSSPDDQR